MPTTPEAILRQANSQEPPNFSLFPLYIVSFIAVLGFSVAIPFFVFLVEHFGGGPFTYGILVATYPIFQLIGSTVLGRWSERYGRRKILLLSQLGTLVSWIVFLIAFFVPRIDMGIPEIHLSLPLLILFAARAIDGATGGNISVAYAYLGDVSSEADRNRDFGRISISSNMGFIIGPVLAGVLGSTSYGLFAPIIAVVVIAFIGLIAIYCYLPESRPCEDPPMPHQNLRRVFGFEIRECDRPSGQEGNVQIRDLLRMKNIPALMALYFIILFGFNIFYVSFPLHSVDNLTWDVGELGVFFSFISAIMVVVQGPVLERISHRVKEKTLIASGSILLSANFIMLTSSSVSLTYLAAAFFAVGNGIMWPSFLSVVSAAAGKFQGSVHGLAGSVGAFASITGLVLGGVLYSVAGHFSFLAAAASMGLVFFASRSYFLPNP